MAVPTEQTPGSLLEHASCLLNTFEFCTQFSFIINAVLFLRFNLIKAVHDALVICGFEASVSYDARISIEFITYLGICHGARTRWQWLVSFQCRVIDEPCTMSNCRFKFNSGIQSNLEYIRFHQISLAVGCKFCALLGYRQVSFYQVKKQQKLANVLCTLHDFKEKSRIRRFQSQSAFYL